MLFKISLKILFPGCKDSKLGELLKELFQTPYFRIAVVDDEETVEMCGALKVVMLSDIDLKQLNILLT